MAIGEYSGVTWAWRALVESIKLDQMTVNDNNIVIAERMLYADHKTQGSYEWDNHTGHFALDLAHMFYLGFDGTDTWPFSRTVFFPAYLPDHMAYSHIMLRFHICYIIAGGAPSCNITLEYYDPLCDDDENQPFIDEDFDGVASYEFSASLIGWTPSEMAHWKLTITTGTRLGLAYSGCIVTYVRTDL